MSNPHVIVWDLDGTLGDFYALEKNCDGHFAVKVTTRPDLTTTLQALGRAGFVHCVLTMATSGYAEVSLRGTGLREYFASVEGQGQRRKGDVAGLARHFSIPAAEVAARILFVGDRMVFDEPDDPEVVFHLEPCALTRPAEQLERLVLHLREAGGSGSLRQGFRTVGLGARKWYHLRRRSSLPVGKPSQRDVGGLGSLVLLERQGACPVIGYAKAPAPATTAEEHSFVPARVWGKAAPGAVP
jgi:hypothetical protein